MPVCVMAGQNSHFYEIGQNWLSMVDIHTHVRWYTCPCMVSDFEF